MKLKIISRGLKLKRAKGAGLSLSLPLWLALGLFGAACNLPHVNDEGSLVPRTADQNPDLPQITLTVASKSRAVHLETFGDPASPALFVVHGGPGNDYRHLKPLAALSDRYFVVMWDQRGGGLSERIGEEEISFDYYIDELKALKNRFSPGAPITLLGESWGGIYVMMYVERYPGDVDQIVLLEPGPLSSSLHGNYDDEALSFGILSDMVQELVWSGEFISASDHETLDYKFMMVQHDGLKPMMCGASSYYPQWRPGAYVTYVAMENLIGEGLSYDFTGSIGSINKKVLILASSCSPLGVDFQAKRHVPLFPIVELVEIPSSGHFPTVDNPLATLAALRGYLSLYP